MAALLQIGLGKNLEPMGCMEIKKMGGLNAITHRKGKLLQDLPAHGVLPASGWMKADSSGK